MSIRIPIISEFDGTGIERAAKQFANLETTGEKAAFALKKAFVPAIAAVGGLAAAAMPAIKAASDLNETMSKSNVIFGDAAKTVQQFAGNAARALGQSKQQALDAASTFAIFGKAAGLAGNDLAKFSTDFVTLASDLASFNNTSPEQAIQAIGAALRGETEPLRAYGVMLNDAALKQAALELGIYSGNDALTTQQKVLAAQKLIYEETTLAQGDFSRTSEGLANQTKILTAELENAKTKIGEQLLPVILAFTPFLVDMATWLGENSQLVVVLATAVAGLSAAIVAANLGLIAYNKTAAITRSANILLSSSFQGAAVSIRGMSLALGLVGLTITEFYSMMRDDSAWRAFKQAASNAFTLVNNTFMVVANQIRNAVTLVANGMIQIANVGIDALNALNPFSDIPRFTEYEYAAWNEGFRQFDFSGVVTPSPMGDFRPGFTGNLQGMFPAVTTPTGTPPPLPPPPPPGGSSSNKKSFTGGFTADYGAGLYNYDLATSFGAMVADSAPNITVNINGGLGTSAEIGEAVVNAIRQYNQVQGPANIAVA
jgi:hypothetical protein